MRLSPRPDPHPLLELNNQSDIQESLSGALVEGITMPSGAAVTALAVIMAEVRTAVTDSISDRYQSSDNDDGKSKTHCS